MSIRKLITRAAVWMACCGVMMPATIRAEVNTATASTANQVQAKTVGDVVLGESGKLVGRVVDDQGNAAVRVPVSIRHRGVQVVQCVTDENGVFVGENLHGGVHEVVTPNNISSFRLWTPNAAPPMAEPHMHVVNDPVYRGQGPHGGRFRFLTNPWIIGAGVATAIAVPLALNDDDDNAS